MDLPDIGPISICCSRPTRLAGTPPFSVRLGKKEETALSFEELRQAVVDVAREGVDVNRF